MPDASALQAPAEITADELWRLDGFEHYELDEGKLLEMTPSGPRHGKIALKLGRLLGEHVEKHGLGETFGAETGFALSKKTVRAPDVAFVSAERIPASGLPEEGFFPGAPDLAIEVLSPSDRQHPGAVARKVAQYLEAGTKLVWIVDPRAGRVTIFRPDNSIEMLGREGFLDAAPVAPGFSCQVREFL